MLNICRQFQIDGAPLSCERYGNGHINETYLVITERGTWYILQKINAHVFKNVEKLMENISSVTSFLGKKDSDPRHVLTIVPAHDNRSWISMSEGAFRMYVFVTDSVCLDRAESPEDFYNSALAFGRFQNMLADFPAETLYETIPHFHDTPARLKRLEEVISLDPCGLAHTVRPEIDFILARRDDCAYMTNLLKEGKLPLRVTHNDTKLNNVMLDAKTREPLCVIDLDTVMPGLAANDFGDSIRFGASTAAEDETDLAKVEMSLPLYKVFSKGFIKACGGKLTETEVLTLPYGAKLMTMECGIRFLTDYLEGNVYFHTNYPKHNLDRCRTQLKLVRDMESKWSEMLEIVREELSK